jgi:methyl-accepting chemotaxis protein
VTSSAKRTAPKRSAAASTSPIDSQDALALWTALNQSSALIEFDLDGIVLAANANFLALMGYTEAEVIGQHHSLFMEPEEARSKEYKQLWATLGQGIFLGGEFRRLAKGGKEVWLRASYNPVLDSRGKPKKVIKLAADITDVKNKSAADASTIEAIERSMAVIEFDPEGTILRANAIFLKVMGYTESEIVGRLHRLFVETEEADSPAYKQFWQALARGESQRGQFKRITKSGEPVWLEASYNPILDASGKLVRVVKFAYDITDQFNQAMALMGEKSAQLQAALEEAQEAERVRLDLDRTLQEMSTPVTPIWDEILLLPLVGIVDSTRTDDVMRKTLDRISQTGSKMFILDISGVPTVDTAVANQLIKITKATRIMGCETLVSGVSSSIAHTIVELGVDISELRTTATLRDAFSTCLSEMGVLDLQNGRGRSPSQRPMHRQRSFR